MKVEDILHLYQGNKDLVALADSIKEKEGQKFQIKGLVGSQLALMVGGLYRLTQKNIVVLVNDKEEALYLHNDLKAFMPKKEIFFFPASYKRPYQIEEVDNANVLQRAEVLNALNHTRSGRQMIVTFAEALNEKIINKKTLIKKYPGNPTRNGTGDGIC